MGNIRGYRTLSPEEVGQINVIKGKAEEVGALVSVVGQGIRTRQDFGQEAVMEPDPRWMAIANTHLQEGFMALVRAVAKPSGF